MSRVLCKTRGKCVGRLRKRRAERLRKTHVRSRPTHLTRVLQSTRLRKTRVIRLRKRCVKYDTMSDFPLLPLGTNPGWVLISDSHPYSGVELRP